MYCNSRQMNCFDSAELAASPTTEGSRIGAIYMQTSEAHWTSQVAWLPPDVGT
jgi:hypothetical protein